MLRLISQRIRIANRIERRLIPKRFFSNGKPNEGEDKLKLPTMEEIREAVKKRSKTRRENTFDNVALEKELELLKQRLSQEVDKFLGWRKQYQFAFVFAGVLIGSLSLTFGTILYVRRNPDTIDKGLAFVAREQFHLCNSYEDRKKVFLSIPEPEIPVNAFEDEILDKINNYYSNADSVNTNLQREGINDDSNKIEVILQWAEMVDYAFKILERSHLIKVKSELRSLLVEEVLRDTDLSLSKRLVEIRTLMSEGIERDVIIESEVNQHLRANRWIKSFILESNPTSSTSVTREVSNKFLETSITYFPGGITKMVNLLNSEIEVGEVCKSLLPPPKEEEAQEKYSKDFQLLKNSLLTIKEKYNSLSHRIKNCVLQTAISNTITILPKLGTPNDKGEKITTDLKARGHEDNNDDDNDNVENPSKKMNRTNSIGIVNLKKEDKGEANNYDNIIYKNEGKTLVGDKRSVRPYEVYVNAIEEDLLGPLRRDAQIDESILQQVKMVFLALPGDIQARILLTAIQHPNSKGVTTPNGQATVIRDLMSAGGVVAVKLAQVICEDPRCPENYRSLLGSLRDTNEAMSVTELFHLLPPAVRLSFSHLGECLGTGSVKQVNKAKLLDGREVAVAVLRRRVEDEALASLGALSASDELEPVASRLGRLVYGEFNLFEEGEVLEEFSLTNIGKHPMFHVVKVIHHSPKCIIEEIANGPTIAKVLKNVTKDSPRSPEIEKTLSTLTEFHRTILKAFIEDGIIHSDIHLGNVSQNIQQDGSVWFNLFDVGQFAHIGPADTTALLWAMSWISTPQRRKMLKNIALKHLTQVSTLKNPKLSGKDKIKEIERLIFMAFEEALQPFPDGSEPDKKTAWILFLRNSERNGVILPRGAFAVAKMMDSVVSQQASYGLPSVLDEAVESFLRKNMSWLELIDVGVQSVVN